MGGTFRGKAPGSGRTTRDFSVLVHYWLKPRKAADGKSPSETNWKAKSGGKILPVSNFDRSNSESNHIVTWPLYKTSWSPEPLAKLESYREVWLELRLACSIVYSISQSASNNTGTAATREGIISTPTPQRKQLRSDYSSVCDNERLMRGFVPNCQPVCYSNSIHVCNNN